MDPLSPTSKALVMDKEKEAAGLIRAYFLQLTDGCGRRDCKSLVCASSQRATARTKQDAALESLKLAKTSGPSMLCVKPAVKEICDASAESQKSSTYEHLTAMAAAVFSSADVLRDTFTTGEAAEEVAVDYGSLRLVYDELTKAPEEVHHAVASAIEKLLASMRPFGRTCALLTSGRALTPIVALLENPLMIEASYHDSILPMLLSVVAALPAAAAAKLTTWWSLYSPSEMLPLLRVVHQYITIHVLTEAAASDRYLINRDLPIEAALKLLALLHAAKKSAAAAGREVLPDTAFRNDAIDEHAQGKADYLLWKEPREGFFSLCSFPFMLSAQGLFELLSVENVEQQRENINPLEAILLGRASMYCRLVVSRQQVIRDTITQLGAIANEDPRQLRKRLRVEFLNEEGIDEGGVQKEFFQIIFRSLFDPDYGMFVYDQETRLHWFNRSSVETPEEFKLLGIVIAIALYNNVILDVHFPRAVYRKLLGQPVGFADLQEVNPGLARGFTQLLEYAGDDLADVYGWHFCVEYEEFGVTRTVDLCENGRDIALSQANKAEFVRLYTKYVLEDSIATQFEAFRTGFNLVVGTSEVIRSFVGPPELELLLVGTLDLDLLQLRDHAVYDGYTAAHPVIQWFWDVVGKMTDEEKKRLLTFSTGSERVPAGGLGKLRFIIVKQGGDSDRLPTAHTCFNALMLPEYSSREKLERLLRTAITHAEGFGML